MAAKKQNEKPKAAAQTLISAGELETRLAKAAFEKHKKTTGEKITFGSWLIKNAMRAPEKAAIVVEDARQHDDYDDISEMIYPPGEKAEVRTMIFEAAMTKRIEAAATRGAYAASAKLLEAIAMKMAAALGEQASATRRLESEIGALRAALEITSAAQEMASTERIRH